MQKDGSKSRVRACGLQDTRAAVGRVPSRGVCAFYNDLKAFDLFALNLQIVDAHWTFPSTDLELSSQICLFTNMSFVQEVAPPVAANSPCAVRSALRS